MEEEERQYQQAFGVHTGISEACKEIVKNSEDTENFTNQAFRLLGQYIANNTILENINLCVCRLTDEKMASLFSELTHSTSLINLNLSVNSFGIEGVRSMIPFLQTQNSPNLSTLFMGGNNINLECFMVLVSALNGTSIEKLYFLNCNITDISALETYTLPRLKELILNGNHVGRDGCRILSNLLQKDRSTLKELYLINTGINDEGAELLANSLKQNTTLKKLHLSSNNGITEKGCKAFLKLLLGVSSTIESTYKSNHTLTMQFDWYI